MLIPRYQFAYNDQNIINNCQYTSGSYHRGYVNIFTDPNALAMPPKVEFEQVKGMALSMSKLVLNGRMDEVLDTIKANYKHLKEVF